MWSVALTSAQGIKPMIPPRSRLREFNKRKARRAAAKFARGEAVGCEASVTAEGVAGREAFVTAKVTQRQISSVSKGGSFGSGQALPDREVVCGSVAQVVRAHP